MSNTSGNWISRSHVTGCPEWHTIGACNCNYTPHEPPPPAWHGPEDPYRYRGTPSGPWVEVAIILCVVVMVLSFTAFTVQQVI